MIQEIAELFSDDIYQEALRRFGFDRGTAIGGFESYVYECERDGESFIMKITHTIRRSPQYIMGELDFVSYLKSQGVPTSSAIPSTEGQLIETIDGEKGMFLAYVFEKAQGMLVGRKNWNPGLFHNLGRLMGRIHSLSKDFEPSNESFRRQQWHEEETLKIEKYVPRSESVVHQNALMLMERLHALPKDRHSYGLTHGDLHQRNFFWHEGVISPFDFDDCVYSWFASDIAIALYCAARHDMSSSVDPWTDMDRATFVQYFLKHFMSGYLSQNDLDPTWLTHIPDFLTLSAIIMYVIGLQLRDTREPSEQHRATLRFHREAIENDSWTHLGFSRE